MSIFRRSRIVVEPQALFHGRTRTANLYCCVWSGHNGSITIRVHSGVTKRIECRLYYINRPRPWNKCVKQLSGVW